MILIAGPWVSSDIRNQFNTVAGAIGSGTTGENFYEPEDIPDPQYGTAFAVYSEDDNSFMFYKRQGVPHIGDMFNDRRVTAVYTDFEERTADYGDGKYDAGAWHYYDAEIKSVFVVDMGIRPKDISRWFSNLTALTAVNIRNLDMSECTEATYLFHGCTSLTTVNLSNWQTPELVTVGGMFERCDNLGSINLNGWNAPKVTSCWFMLYGTAAEAIDLSGVTFGKIDSAQSLFSGNYSLKSVKFGAGIDFSSTTKCTRCFTTAASCSLIAPNGTFALMLNIAISMRVLQAWFSPGRGN